MGETKRGVKGKNSYLNFLDKVSFGQIFVFWIVMTINFGIIYFLFSLSPDHAVAYRDKLIEPNIAGLVNSVYYSFITVTTTGYGDLSPNGLSKLFAILEVVFGVIIQGIVVSKLVSFKQETILEEIYNINYEEAFTNYRRGLSLVRTDIVMIMEKIENKTIKPREIKDLWIVFSGLDQTLTNIKNLVMPGKEQGYYNKKLDISKIELILNSMKLSMNKVTELVKILKIHNLEWRDELLMTSIYYDIQTCREIIDHEMKRSLDRKLIDKLNALRIIIDELEEELKTNYRKKIDPETINTAPPKIEEVFNYPIKEELKVEAPQKFDKPEDIAAPPKIDHKEDHEGHHNSHHHEAHHIEKAEPHSHEAVLDPRVSHIPGPEEERKDQ